MGDGSQEIAATARCTARAERAGVLRSLLIERLGEVIGPGARVGYLDFPFHTNPGDSMIFEGTMAAFAALSIDVVQLSDQASYRAKDYVSLPADTVMVFHGGGNFGDLYPGIHARRLTELADLADFRLVVMPQTLNVTDDSDAGIGETRRVLESLPHLSLLWRDRPSADLASELFPSTRSLLVPDAAFGLKALPRTPKQGLGRIGVLARTDAESAGQFSPDAEPWPVADWSYRGAGRGAAAAALAGDRALLRLIRRNPVLARTGAARWLYRHHARLLTTIARHGGLGRNDAVVVNRLHAWIAAVLTGVDVVAVETAPPKIGPMVSTWFPEEPPIAMTPTVALERARALWC